MDCLNHKSYIQCSDNLLLNKSREQFEMEIKKQFSGHNIKQSLNEGNKGI